VSAAVQQETSPLNSEKSQV